MLHQNSHTAILLFTRQSREESVAKNLLPQQKPGVNKRLAQQMIDRSIIVAGKSGFPVIVWDEKMQCGATFGQKLANAVEATLQKGYQKVIVIGNDCLHLTNRHILEAATALQTNDAVIAPTQKGGVYLIGISQHSFDKKLFAAIRWQTCFTNQDLLDFYSPNLICKLPVLDDVNDFADLQKQIRLLTQADPFRNFAISVIASLQKLFIHFQYRLSVSIPYNLFGLKAPPSAFSII